MGLVAVDTEEIYLHRNDPQNLDMFPLFYTLNISENSHSYIYNNSYKAVEFTMTDSFQFREYFFLCPTKDRFFHNTVLLHVSKEYNVCPFVEPRMLGRFLLSNILPEQSNSLDSVVLAEEPGEAYVEPNFNVELHYLRIRKYVRQGKICEGLGRHRHSFFSICFLQ